MYNYVESQVFKNIFSMVASRMTAKKSQNKSHQDNWLHIYDYKIVKELCLHINDI